MSCDRRAQRSCHWEACHLGTLARGSATRDGISSNQDLASQVRASVMTTTDIVSELYMVHLGLGNSFVFNPLFLSLNVFQKRKPKRIGARVLLNLALLPSWWTVSKGVSGTALGDALKALTNSLPCHPPTLKQNRLRLSWYESQRVGGITISGS